MDIGGPPILKFTLVYLCIRVRLLFQSYSKFGAYSSVKRAYYRLFLSIAVQAAINAFFYGDFILLKAVARGRAVVRWCIWPVWMFHKSERDD